MQTKKFHLGDILSIIWCRVLSQRGMTGVYKLLDYLHGEKLPTCKTSQAFNGYRIHLIVQFPELASDEMEVAIRRLDESLKHRKGRGEPGKILAEWLVPLVAEYGEMFEVEPLPRNVFHFKDPIAEAVAASKMQL